MSSMNSIEIPLLRESATYARRLIQAAQTFADSRYYFHRRINWSYRYSKIYYSHESALFQAMPDAYIRGDVSTEPQLDDVYAKRLSGKQTFAVVIKVMAHTLFALVGCLADSRARRAKVSIYRKAYVDDIELVYDPEQQSVLRAVYPFPINVKRQLRYLHFLHRKGYRFKLAGNPYRMHDLINFLRQRTVYALMRMESKAQVRHAREVSALGVHTVQLSDEFDIGSLDFVRALSRLGVSGENSAHGVGKYFPVHAYEKFETLTLKQQTYYYASRQCNYSLRQLNDFSKVSRLSTPNSSLNIVFLSQTFNGVSPLVYQAEESVTKKIASEISIYPSVNLWYKHHPNNQTPTVPSGFEYLPVLDDVNNGGSVFISMFSTCHIDPAFKGRKILVREALIRPEIAFDDSEHIVDLDELITILRHEVSCELS